MNESQDHKSVNPSMESQEQTLYQKKLQKEQSKQVNSKKALGLFAGFLFILIIVVFLLPSFVEDNEEKISEVSESEISPIILNQVILAKKPIAEALLSELLIKMESLKLEGILFWGMGDWEQVLLAQQAGDSAFIDQKYDLAAIQYRQALQKLSDMEISIPDVLANALEQGSKSLTNGNKDEAISNFEIALAINGNNAEAKRGLDRALKLDQVIERTTRGETEFVLGNFESSVQSFENALKIDAEWKPAMLGLEKSEMAYEEQTFQSSISKGFQFLANGSFDDAERLFNQALLIRQDSKEAQQALDELNLKKIASLTKSFKYKALIAEVNEEWNQAKGFYEEILVIDPNIEEVKESLNRVESRILLDAEMTSIIARSDYYNDDKVFGQAQAILQTAKSIERIGPKMGALVEKLDSLIKIASIPMKVILESDELTEITIFKVAQIGSFQQKMVSLRPGIYTARGSRKGFMDETIRFRVEPNKQNQIFRIICSKKI